MIHKTIYRNSHNFNKFFKLCHVLSLVITNIQSYIMSNNYILIFLVLFTTECKKIYQILIKIRICHNIYTCLCQELFPLTLSQYIYLFVSELFPLTLSQYLYLFVSELFPLTLSQYIYLFVSRVISLDSVTISILVCVRVISLDCHNIYTCLCRGYFP